MSIYQCACGVDAVFFCNQDQSHLCLPHFQVHISSHDSYFNLNSVSQSEIKGLCNELQKLKKKIEDQMNELQDSLNEIYKEINELFEKEYSKLVSSLHSIQILVDTLNSENNYVKALSIFPKLYSNPKLLIESIFHRVNLFKNQNYLRKFNKIIKVYSDIDSLVQEFTEPEIPDDEMKQMMNLKYEIQKKASTFKGIDEDSIINEWIQSLTVQRNIDNYKSLALNGEDYDYKTITALSFLPTVFFLKEIALVSFESNSFEQVSQEFLLKCKHLNKLLIDDCDLTKKSVSIINQALVSCQPLKEFIINKCESGDIINQIILNLNLTQLTTLVISKAMISDESIEIISKLFPKTPELKYLHLDSNNFTIQGSIFLVIYLPFLKQLIDINLSNNKIGECVGLICQSLARIQYLRSLNLSSTDTHSSQYDLILSSLPRLKHLESVYFDMTIPENILSTLKQNLPNYTHIYRENPEQAMSFEFK